jgi:membrane-associated phospholipid phosphatase
MPKFINFYSIATLLFVLLGCVLLLIYGDKVMLLAINQAHSPLLDKVHYLLSEYGRGESILLMLTCLLLIPQLRNKIYLKYASIYGASAIIISYVLKHLFQRDRPLSVYRADVHVIDWIDNAFQNSLPSGHTLAAFSVFAFLIFAFQQLPKYAQVPFFLLALGVGVSRVYLAQHFVSDIVLGALLGLFIGYITGGLYHKKVTSQI